jgi:outer membrane protein TolC
MKHLVIPILALLVPSSARAAPLTIEAAVGRALGRAPELAALRAGEAAAEARVGQARSAYLPRLGADVTYSAHWPKNELAIALPPGLPFAITLPEVDDVHRFRAGAQVGLRVLDLSRGPRVEAAKSSLASEAARTRETAAALAFQVRATFLAGLFARDVTAIAGESLRLALAEEKRAALKAEVGTGSAVALAQARVRVASLRAQLRQAENELARYRQQLQSLLALGELPELEGELAALAGAPAISRPLAEAPGVERLRAARLAAEQAARSTSRGFWPTLSLMARADVGYPNAMKLEWGPLFQGGVSLNWDFYDGGLRQKQAREARAQAASAAAASQAAEESLRRKLIELAARERTARAELESARETLAQTEIYLRVAKAAVEAGTGTALDVHTAELGLDRARIAVKQALLQQALVKAEAMMVHGLSTGALPRGVGVGAPAAQRDQPTGGKR